MSPEILITVVVTMVITSTLLMTIALSADLGADAKGLTALYFGLSVALTVLTGTYMVGIKHGTDQTSSLNEIAKDPVNQDTPSLPRGADTDQQKAPGKTTK